MPLLDSSANGVYTIAATPFTDDGAVDAASLDRLMDFYVGAGITGVTVLGIMGEAPKLTHGEAVALTKQVVRRVSGLPVIVGASAPGFAQMAALAKDVMDAGAGGVMIAPPGTLKTDDQIVTYYANAAEAIGADVPFVLQDYPYASGVYMAPSVIRRIVTDNPSCKIVKHEEWPGLEKLTSLKTMMTNGMRKVAILCGNGGIFLPHELERGADGANTGYAYPEMLVQLVKLIKSGQRDEAHDLFDRHLPLLRYEQQPGMLGLAVRKYILKRRGAIASDAQRKPGIKLSKEAIAEIEFLIARVERNHRMNARPDVRMAVDIGGTFTDIVLDRGETRITRKVLTTAKRPEEGVLDGARLVLGDAGLHFSDIDVFVHGTTLATNAIIERRGARTALIATDGFRDTLDIATESRYDQYDLTIEKPKPLVPRSLRFTVPERVDVHGAVRLALDEAAVAAQVARLKDNGIEAVAICFMHSYVNAAHEQRTAEILHKAMPGLSITLSSEVCPEIREYERTSTAVANAYVQPLMDGYLARMDQALRQEQYRGAVYLVTSGGGLTSIETARKFPVRLVESGPAGGAIFASQIAARGAEKKVLSFDMGGTTAKICLIENFEPNSARVYEVDRAARFLKGSGLPVRIPVIEMVEIGAGGGSIAHVDALKRVSVGPESAGSEPGPACYRRGGTRPTVTDADVALGMIDPAAFAGGTIALDPELSRKALAKDVGEALGMDAETAAYAVHEMVCENMASAARVHVVERGEVVGDHTLIAFGGAAPLHAARVAEKLGVARVLVPPNAGVGSAVGFLVAPISYELVKSRHMRLDNFDFAGASALLAEMTRDARALVEPGARGAPVTERRIAYMRYVGQGHEIMVPLPVRDVTANDASTLRTQFETEYAVLFKRPIPGAAIEVLSWSVLISTQAQRPVALVQAAETRAPSPDGSRAFFDGRAGSTIDVPTYRRSRLEAGVRVPGPAIIAEDETSTFITASFDARIDAAGCIVMERRANA